MKLHRDARLSVKVRELLVDRVENVVGDKGTNSVICTQRRHLLAPDSTARRTVAGCDRATRSEL
jgi:hypothetical protein